MERFFVFQTTPPTKKSTPPILPRTGKQGGEQKANLTEVEREPHWGRGGGKTNRKPRKRHHHTAGEGATPTAHQKKTPKEKEKEKEKEKQQQKNNFKNNFSKQKYFYGIIKTRKALPQVSDYPTGENGKAKEWKMSATTTPTPTEEPKQQQQQEQGQAKAKTFTQEDIDAIIGKTKAEMKAKQQSELEQALKAERERIEAEAKMTEEEREKARDEEFKKQILLLAKK